MSNWVDEHFKQRKMLLDSIDRILELREKAAGPPWKKETIFTKILKFFKLK